MTKKDVTITVEKLKFILNKYLDSDIIVMRSCGFEDEHCAELYILDKTKTRWYQDILHTEHD